ncbi:MAG: MalY/PatB family protein [Chloroflexota bacterium]
MPCNFDAITDRRASNSIKWRRYPEDVLPMWVADMDFPAPPPVLEALRRAVEHGVFGYEMPSRELSAAVAARMEALYNWRVEPEMVVAIPGLVSGFNAAAWTVCAPGEGVLMQTPVYFPFLKVHENVGLARQAAELACERQGSAVRYRVDWEAFETAANSGGVPTRMFLLCNPHNPTGQVYTPADLSRMAEVCEKRDIFICSDEIHSELLLGGAQHIPIATLAPEIAARTITLIAPSKTFNVAGLFCGFALIPDPGLRDRYKGVIERLTLHVNSLGQVAAQAALSGACDGWLADLNAYLTANRDFLAAYVRERLPGVRVTVPDATYLAWLDCSGLAAAGKIEGSPYQFFLEKAKVALNDGADFGPGGEGFVRLNFGCPRSVLEDGLERIRRALAG